jgi:hypothetical protein
MTSSINIQCEPSPELCDYLGTKPAPGQPTAIAEETGTIITDESSQTLVEE